MLEIKTQIKDKMLEDRLGLLRNKWIQLINKIAEKLLKLSQQMKFWTLSPKILIIKWFFKQVWVIRMLFRFLKLQEAPFTKKKLETVQVEVWLQPISRNRETTISWIIWIKKCKKRIVLWSLTISRLLRQETVPNNGTKSKLGEVPSKIFKTRLNSQVEIIQISYLNYSFYII